jgi:molybdopterin-binding protein
MLKVERLNVRAGDFLLQDISFEVKDDEYFILLGRSGVGKTTLLEAIAGFLIPTSGKIWLDGVDITKKKIQEREIGIVYQDHLLFPHLSVRKNISYGMGRRKLRRRHREDRIDRIAADVGALELLSREPSTLSGGEMKRIALARALAREPRCLLMDEPLASLDAKAQLGLRALLRRLAGTGKAVIHVTHSYEEAVSLGERVAVMEAGRIAEIGTAEAIFRHPKSEFVAGFIGIRNFFRGTLEPSVGETGLADFHTAGPVLKIAIRGESGPGHVMFRGEDITISNTRPETSARNVFQGAIIDVARSTSGIEVTVDVGIEVEARVTENSVHRMGLAAGKRVWVSFKATAGRFISD